MKKGKSWKNMQKNPHNWWREKSYGDLTKNQRTSLQQAA